MDNILNDKLSKISIDKNEKRSDFSIQDYAIAFVYGMGKTQRERFKQMLESGYECGKAIASNYHVDYDIFIKEVKRVLNVEV